VPAVRVSLAGRPRAGFVAALATALYAPLGFSAHTALSDALFAFLFVATAWAFLRALAAVLEDATGTGALRTPTAEESKDVSAYAAEHGMANACRILLNCNEFMFVN